MVAKDMDVLVQVTIRIPITEDIPEPEFVDREGTNPDRPAKVMKNEAAVLKARSKAAKKAETAAADAAKSIDGYESHMVLEVSDA